MKTKTVYKLTVTYRYPSGRLGRLIGTYRYRKWAQDQIEIDKAWIKAKGRTLVSVEIKPVEIPA